MLFCDQLAACSRGGVDGTIAHIFHCLALGSGDLVFRHPLTALDHCLAVGFSLLEKGIRLMLRVGEHGFSVLFGAGDLVRIFLAQRFGFGAKLFRLVELLLDGGDLAVQPTADGLVYLRAEKRDQQQNEHRDRNNLKRRETEQFGLGMRRCTAMPRLDEGVGRFGGEYFRGDISHGSSPP